MLLSCASIYELFEILDCVVFWFRRQNSRQQSGEFVPKHSVIYYHMFSLIVLIINCKLPTELQKQRLEALTREYSVELEIVCEEFDLERAMLIEQHNVEMNDIADILFAMDQNFQERESEAKSEFQSMRDEIKNKVSVAFLYMIQSNIFYFFLCF